MRTVAWLAITPETKSTRDRTLSSEMVTVLPGGLAAGIVTVTEFPTCHDRSLLFGRVNDMSQSLTPNESMAGVTMIDP